MLVIIMEITLKHIGKKTFVGKGRYGQDVRMGIPKKVGGDGSGTSPMDILLMSVGTCMGMDILHILEQQNQSIDAMDVKVDGQVSGDFPKKFTKIEVHFTISGPNLTVDSVDRAIDLSKEKYCSVSASLDPDMEKIYTYDIVD